MQTSLRHHVVLLLTLLLALLAVQGMLSVWLIGQLGHRIDAILRENYDSVRAMERLNEALERIDSSFQFAMLGQEAEARKDYRANWEQLEKQYNIETGNITILPEERELVEKLRERKDRYREDGDRFYRLDPGDPQRREIYLGTAEQPGLLGGFRGIKEVSGRILQINQENMETASTDAKQAARMARLGIGICLALAVGTALVVWRLATSLIRPIEAMTRAAQAIGEGQLHRTVPVIGTGELAVLAHTFNTMTQHLRDYRQSNSNRLLRSQQTSQATIDSFPDPVLVIDPMGRVDLANPAARRLLGVAPRSDASSVALPWQPPEPLRKPLSEALNGQQAYLTTSFDQAVTFRLDGADHAYLPQISPIRDPYGAILGAAVVLNDVTRFRLLDQLKTDLVSTVSHELKTPLASLRLALHVLLEETVGPLAPKQTELLVDARDSAERLLELIEHLLALARLEHGREPLQRVAVSPAELLRDAVDAVFARAQGKGITLMVEAVDHLPPLCADPMRMGLALNNLLDNAITYSVSGGKITVSAEQVDGETICLIIADTGIGIPAESLPHVFERFFRVPGVSHPAGTGLGLAIVKEVVVAHGGQVRCQSKVGEGTVFRLTLPIWKGDAQC
jgi:two-component system, NtrC family, sensor histidine kinase KinB